jgi:hypothetical protein
MCRRARHLEAELGEEMQKLMQEEVKELTKQILKGDEVIKFCGPCFVNRLGCLCQACDGLGKRNKLMGNGLLQECVVLVDLNGVERLHLCFMRNGRVLESKYGGGRGIFEAFKGDDGKMRKLLLDEEAKEGKKEEKLIGKKRGPPKGSERVTDPKKRLVKQMAGELDQLKGELSQHEENLKLGGLDEKEMKRVQKRVRFLDRKIESGFLDLMGLMEGPEKEEEEMEMDQLFNELGGNVLKRAWLAMEMGMPLPDKLCEQDEEISVGFNAEDDDDAFGINSKVDEIDDLLKTDFTTSSELLI